MNLPHDFSGLSAIIVTHNSEDYLTYCLGSLSLAIAKIPSEIIVIDNASQRSPQEIFAERFPGVIWVNSPSNVGFGTACNRGAAEAKYSHLLFVNPDTIIPQETILQLLDRMAMDKQLGLVGARILNADGSLQKAGRRSFPTPQAALARLLGFDRIWPQSRVFGRYNMTYLGDDQESEVDAISGSFFCVNKTIFDQVNGFDQDFFMYGEDLDLSFRVQKMGYKNLYFSKAHIVHIKGHSSKNKPWFSYYHFYLAMLVFVDKHADRIKLPKFSVKLGIILFALLGAIPKIMAPKVKTISALFASVLLIANFDKFQNNILLLLGYFWISSIILNRLAARHLSYILFALICSLICFWDTEFWIPFFALVGIEFISFAEKALSPIFTRKKKILWYLSDDFPTDYVFPENADIMIAIRNLQDWKLWKASNLMNLVKIDEIWLSGSQIWNPEVQTILSESEKDQQICLVISERYGINTKLELNLLGTSLNLNQNL